MIRISKLTLLISFLLIPLQPTEAQWVQTSSGITTNWTYCLAALGRNLFVGTTDGIFLSADNGNTWNAADSGLADYAWVYCFAVSETKLFAGSSFGVYVSSDTGKSWKAAGLPNTIINSIAVLDTDIFAGTAENGVFLSTNSGQSWAEKDSGLSYLFIGRLAVSGANLLASTDFGVFLSRDNGDSWSGPSLNWNNVFVKSLFSCSSNLFAGTFGGGTFLSIDNGVSWNSIGPSNIVVDCFAFSDSLLFAGLAGGGVLFSTDNGSNWKPFGTKLPNFTVQALTSIDSNLFAATYGAGVWRKPASQVVESAKMPFANLLAQYSLDQNFPNPFNSTTTIGFSISQRTFVSLKVTDVLGRYISTIVSDELPPGRYSRHWNAANIPSGIYFYHLQTAGYSETKKLLLLK